MTIHLILASASPRRRELLALFDLPFTVLTPAQLPHRSEVDETPHPGESPFNLVQRLSREKAAAVANHLNPHLLPPEARAASRLVVVAADTIVVLNDDILGKPVSPADAVRMLRQLRRHKIHHVYSGVTVQAVPLAGNTAEPPVTRVHTSRVWMRPYTDAEIEAYVASGDPLDKAGAYAIQHPEFAPVERLEGCFASVMGLPLGELAAALAEAKIPVSGTAERCTRYFNRVCCLENR